MKKNKKLIFCIVLCVGCILLVICLTSKKFFVDNSSKNGEILFDNKKVITVPRINGNVILKSLNFLTDIHNVNVYDEKYIVADRKLYDFEGNVSLEAVDYLNYNNGLFRTESGIYNSDGKLLTDLKVGYPPVFSDNYLESNRRFYNYMGELLFDGSSYNNIDYDENLQYFAVEKDDKWGLVNKSGEIILPFEYDIMSIESTGCVIYAKGNNKGKDIWYVYNIKNKKEYGPYIDVTYLKDELIIVDKYLTDDLDNVEQWLVTELCKTYILDLKKDTEVLNDKLGDYFISSANFGSLFGDYIIADEIYGDSGVFDSNFKTVVPFKYDKIEIYEADYLEDKYLELRKGDSRKILNNKLKQVVEFNKEDGVDFYNDLIIKTVNNDISVYDKNGKMLYQTRLAEDESYSYLENGLLLLQNDKNSLCSYVNINNKTKSKINIDYSICDNYWYDDYLFKSSDSKLILFNKDGERILKNEYLTISTYDSYCVVSDEKDKYYIINYQEEKLIDMEFSYYNGLDDGGIVFVALDGSKYYFNYK